SSSPIRPVPTLIRPPTIPSPPLFVFNSQFQYVSRGSQFVSLSVSHYECVFVYRLPASPGIFAAAFKLLDRNKSGCFSGHSDMNQFRVKTSEIYKPVTSMLRHSVAWK